MDTVSLLVYRRVHAAGTWVLIGVAGLGLDVPALQPHADPLLGPFRWQHIPSNVA